MPGTKPVTSYFFSFKQESCCHNLWIRDDTLKGDNVTFVLCSHH